MLVSLRERSSHVHYPNYMQPSKLPTLLRKLETLSDGSTSTRFVPSLDSTLRICDEGKKSRPEQWAYEMLQQEHTTYHDVGTVRHWLLWVIDLLRTWKLLYRIDPSQGATGNTERNEAKVTWRRKFPVMRFFVLSVCMIWVSNRKLSKRTHLHNHTCTVRLLMAYVIIILSSRSLHSTRRVYSQRAESDIAVTAMPITGSLHVVSRLSTVQYQGVVRTTPWTLAW